MSYSHQDWNTVTIRGKSSNKPKPASSTQTEKKRDGGKNQQDAPSILARKIESIVDGDKDLPPKITHSFQIQLQKARQQKGWTQKQLANECSMIESVVRDYENGTANPKPQDIIKMNKALGVTLKNK